MSSRRWKILEELSGKTAVITMGGGIDSTALFVWLMHQRNLARGPSRLHPLFFSYGQRSSILELEAVKLFCAKFGMEPKVMEIDLGAIADSFLLQQGSPGSNLLEGRNVIFGACAATYASTIGADAVLFGFHQEPADAPFPDATERAIDALNSVVAVTYKRPVRFVAPFADLPRTQIALIGNTTFPGFLDMTHSCYLDVAGGCGHCVHCQQQEVIVDYVRHGIEAELPRNY